jgi:hypothetical protein
MVRPRGRLRAAAWPFRWLGLCPQMCCGTVRRRARARRNCLLHGQSVGRCSKRWRAERVSRPGQGEQAAPDGLGDHQVGGAKPDGGHPAKQVVGEGGQDQPGSVGQEHARGAVAQPGAVFEIADGKLADRVAAVVAVQLHRAARSVGDKGVVAPVRPQACLGTDKAAAANDQPVACQVVSATCACPPSG